MKLVFVAVFFLGSLSGFQNADTAPLTVRFNMSWQQERTMYEIRDIWFTNKEACVEFTTFPGIAAKLIELRKSFSPEQLAAIAKLRENLVKLDERFKSLRAEVAAAAGDEVKMAKVRIKISQTPLETSGYTIGIQSDFYRMNMVVNDNCIGGVKQGLTSIPLAAYDITGR